MGSFFKKILSSLLIGSIMLQVSLVTLLAAPSQASARPVYCVNCVNEWSELGSWATNFARWATQIEQMFSLNYLFYVLNPLAWALVKALLADLSQAITNLVLTGGIGNAAQWLTNPYQFFDMLYDRTITSFVNNFANNAGIDPTSRSLIAQGIIMSRTGQYNIQGLLTATIPPATQQQFYNNQTFSWGLWNQQFVHPQNNVYGLAQMSADLLGQQLSNMAAQETNKLLENSGFLPTDSCYKVWNNASILITDPDPTSYLCAALTPGVTIEKLLNEQLDSGRQSFVAADTWGELISAFFEMTAQNVIRQGIMSAWQSMATLNRGNNFNGTIPPGANNIIIPPGACSQPNPPAWCNTPTPTPTPNPNPTPNPTPNPVPPPPPPNPPPPPPAVPPPPPPPPPSGGV